MLVRPELELINYKNFAKKLIPYFPALVTLAAGTLLSLIFFRYVDQKLQTTARLRFEMHSRIQENIIRGKFHDNMFVLKILGDYLANEKNLTREKFNGIVENVLFNHHSGPIALSWNPRITNAEWPSYFHQAKSEGPFPIQFKEFAANGEIRPLSPAPGRDYVVIHYIAPLSKNKKAIGLDISSHPVRREALEKARDTGNSIMAGRINLLQDQEMKKEFGTLLIHPLYKIPPGRENPPLTLQNRRKFLSGYVVAVLRFQNLLAISPEKSHHMDSRIYLFDETAPKKERFLYHYSSGNGDSPILTVPEKDLRQGLHYSSSFSLAGRTWTLLFVPGHSFLNSHHHWPKWWVLISGLFFTCLLTVFLILSLKNNHQLQQEIKQRIKIGKEKTALENRLRLSEKMEAIGTLAGGIAHDFNNILHGIFLCLEGVKNKLPESHPHREKISQAMEYGMRGKDLVKQMLNFTSPQKEKYSPVEISPVIFESLRMLRTILPPPIEFVSRIDPNAGQIWGNKTQIQQVMLNLGTNAGKAIKNSHGRLEITLKKHAHLPESTDHLPWADGSYVELTVTDTGEGIEEQALSRIFEPFYTTRPVGEGTGLGLSIVHGIVQAHKGTISVTTTKGKGTSFTLYFPCWEGGEKFPKRELTTNTSLLMGKILLVDDESSLVDLEREVLESAGHEVLATDFPKKALEIYTDRFAEIDLVVTDQIMPEMTGMQLTTEIRKINPHIPVIIVSGHSDEITPDSLKNHGINAYLMKPFNINELLGVVQEVVTRQKEGKKER